MADDDITTNYIIQKLVPLEPFLIPTPDEYDCLDFFGNTIDNAYPICVEYIENFAFGVYHGTPFLVFSHKDEQKLYLLCPTKNSQPLLAKLINFL